jgi:biotin operon repressor
MNRLTQTPHFVENMRDADLSIGARLLFWELHQWITDDEPTCFPTQLKLAKNLGVHRNSVIRWLQELRDKGLIEDVPQRYGNAYRIRTCASLD